MLIFISQNVCYFVADDGISGIGVFMSSSAFFFFVPFKPVIFVISIIMIKVALISSCITDCSQVQCRLFYSYLA